MNNEEGTQPQCDDGFMRALSYWQNSELFSLQEAKAAVTKEDHENILK